MYDQLGPSKKSRTALPMVLLGLLVGAAVIAGLVLGTRTGDPPLVELTTAKPVIGKRTEVTVVAQEPKRGLVRVEVELIQGKRKFSLASRELTPKPVWELWGAPPEVVRFDLEVGRDTLPELTEGQVVLRVTALGAGALFSSVEPVVRTSTLPVRITPPAVDIRSTQVYVTQGGSEVVVYEVGPTSVKDGVKAGDWWFPGFPLPGGAPGERFALFAVPYDLANVSKVVVYATDEVDNDVEVGFIDRFTPKPFRTDTINVSEAVMQKVVPRIMAETPTFKDRGSLVDNYVAINSQMRADNSERLMALAKQSRPRFSWNRSFVEMNAKVVSSFADRRTYLFEGRVIDRQDHLGFDLASVQRAPIPASNNGLVVLAEFFGIYGNAVVIDHGYGLQSLYAHLSTTNVKLGDTVERGQIIGNTGATGLALGDHLHFTMLLHGLPVTPMEWWDAHWLRDRIARKLGPALAFVYE